MGKSFWGPSTFEFTAEENMPWLDFVNSGFNDGKFSTSEIPIRTIVMFVTEVGPGGVCGPDTSVYASDKIIADYEYTLM